MSGQLVHHYVMHGWLKRLGRGVFVLPGGELDLYASLAAGLKNAHVGGKTALAWHGFRHNLYYKERVQVYGRGQPKVPTWLMDRFDVEVHNRDLFKNYDECGLETWKDFPELKVSEPERAVLEMLSDVPKRQSLEEAQAVVETLYSLRPTLMETMLKNCRSVKTVRLFALMAKVASLPVLESVDPACLRVGSKTDYVLPLTEGTVRLRYG